MHVVFEKSNPYNLRKVFKDVDVDLSWKLKKVKIYAPSTKSNIDKGLKKGDLSQEEPSYVQ